MVRKKQRLIVLNKSDLKKAHTFLKDSPFLALDSETSGLDAHGCHVWSLQIGNDEHSILFPIKKDKLDLDKVADLLMDGSKLCIMHNAKFDLKVLWRLGLDANNVWCTSVTEKALTAGLWSDNSLAGSLKRRLGVEMSKDERKDFYQDVNGHSSDDTGLPAVFEVNGQTWTPELINYALKDVEYLIELFHVQEQEIERRGMNDLIYEIEIPLTPITGLMEYRGILFDRARGVEFQNRMATKAKALGEEVIAQLDTAYITAANPIYKKNLDIWKAWDRERDALMKEEKKLRSDEKDVLTLRIKVAKQAWRKDFETDWYDLYDISPNSRKLTATQRKIKGEWNVKWETQETQMKAGYLANSNSLKSTFKDKRSQVYLIQPFNSIPKAPARINIRSVQQVSLAFEHLGIDVPNLRKETLQERVNEHPLLDDLIEFKKFEKLSQMAEIYERINPVTGRLHGEFNQIVDTGRYSSRKPMQMGL